MFSRIFLLIPAAGGFIISLYFALIYYRIIPSNLRVIPHFCRMRSETCETILHAPDARLFGLPNHITGIGYYLFLIFLSVNIWVEVPLSFARIMFVVSLVAVTVGAYLADSLIRKLKTSCVLCFTAHGINLIIAIILYYNL